MVNTTAQRIEVQINEYGRSLMVVNHYRMLGRYAYVYSFEMPKEDADGWSIWTIQHLMAEFGDCLKQGGPMPFDAMRLMADDELVRLVPEYCLADKAA